MSPRRSFVLLLVTVILAGCLPTPPPYQCADAIGCVNVAPAEPIKIGVLQVLSGELEPLGLRNLRSIELALENRESEILSHSLELTIEDSLCSQEGGATAASKVVADPQIVAIIGPTCSGAAAGALKVVSEAGLVMISGSSTAPSLTSVDGEQGADWQPGFLRTAQNDAVVGRAAATFAIDVLGVKKAATIDDGDPYTRGLTDSFQQAFSELDGEVVLSAAVNKGDTDMEPVLTAVAMSGAELVFFPVFQPEGDYIVQQMANMEDLAPVTMMTAEGLYEATFLEAVGEAATGLNLVIPIRPHGPAHDTFVSQYVAKYGEEPKPPYYAHTYDAANILLQAIEAVAEQEADGTLHIGRQALRDTLYATAEYEGLTGNLNCDGFGDCGVARFQIVRLDDPAAGLEGLAANVVYTYPQDQ